jgi:uncharacterized glyoxalase superfamily protein PhnB
MKAARKVAAQVAPIPEGYHTVTPYLMVRGAERAIAFYKKAFGAEELDRMPGPNGQGIVHAAIRIGNSNVFLGDEYPGMGGGAPETFGGSPVQLFLYVEDVDAAVERAVKAGATIKMPVTDMFWGDRYGKVADPFGYEWGLGTRKEILTQEEIQARGEEFFRGQGGG